MDEPKKNLRGLPMVYMRQNAHVTDGLLPSLQRHQLVGADPACHGGYCLEWLKQKKGREGGGGSVI